VVVDTMAVILLALGLIVTTIGLYGVHRMRGTYNKLHAAGMVSGPGVILVLIASIGTRDPGVIAHAALAVAFVLVSAPISSHAIACAAHRRRAPRAGGVEPWDDGGTGTPDRQGADDGGRRGGDA
jgi:monovalent cation/proton antiporter MnhG/PhaG subunit